MGAVDPKESTVLQNQTKSRAVSFSLHFHFRVGEGSTVVCRSHQTVKAVTFERFVKKEKNNERLCH
jgi:hypothetical protein